MDIEYLEWSLNIQSHVNTLCTTVNYTASCYFVMIEKRSLVWELRTKRRNDAICKLCPFRRTIIIYKGTPSNFINHIISKAYSHRLIIGDFVVNQWLPYVFTLNLKTIWIFKQFYNMDVSFKKYRNNLLNTL